MIALKHRRWVPEDCETYIQEIAGETSRARAQDIASRVEALAVLNRQIHERDCFNLNPATNIMNPRAERLLAEGLGSRPSLGYPGDKYEMGLEAIEGIEVIAAELAAEVFGASFAEIRVASGALSNLYAFMATCEPGDDIIAPPSSIGGHVTHHAAGAAGLYRLKTHAAPIDKDGYTVDTDRLAEMARTVKPALITIGGSLNLFPHPVAKVREIADEVGAKLLFDAAHQCGIIAGGVWENPLEQGAHLMTMSTYKSLGGPAGGLIVTNDAEIAEKLDAIAFPGLTANFDAAKSAALAISLLDWKEYGRAYAEEMIAVAKAMAGEFDRLGLPVFAKERGFTASHQFAIEAARFGGGQTASKKLRKAGFLACGIGLPLPAVEGDMNGLRIGTPEIVRWGVGVKDVPELTDLFNRALTGDEPEKLAEVTAQMRQRFDTLHYILK